MRKPELTLPELFFVVGTRGMLAAGVALLFANRMTANQRKMIGAVLLGFGAVTTIPAAMLVLGTRDRAPDKIEAAPEAALYEAAQDEAATLRQKG